MQLSTAVRPISEVKAQAAEIIRTFSEDAAPPVVITQNGEAKAVLMAFMNMNACRKRWPCSKP